MTPDQRRFVNWTAAGLVIVAAGWGVALWRGGVRSDQATEANRLYTRYRELYHPDKPGGFAVEDAQAELRSTVANQTEELKAAEAALAPAIPEAYLRSDLASANAQVQADLETLRQISARTKVAIPQSLPFQSGLDADAAGRSRQLANLLLVRLAVQSAMQAGVARVVTIAPGDAFASPGRNYAVFTCSLDVEATWAATARLAGAFSAADGRGLGLRGLEIESPTGSTDQPQKVRLIATLTAPNVDAWGLAASTTPAPAPAGAAAPAEGSGRLRRLGTSRP